MQFQRATAWQPCHPTEIPHPLLHPNRRSDDEPTTSPTNQVSAITRSMAGRNAINGNFYPGFCHYSFCRSAQAGGWSRCGLPWRNFQTNRPPLLRRSSPSIKISTLEPPPPFQHPQFHQQNFKLIRHPHRQSPRKKLAGNFPVSSPRSRKAVGLCCRWRFVAS